VPNRPRLSLGGAFCHGRQYRLDRLADKSPRLTRPRADAWGWCRLVETYRGSHNTVTDGTVHAAQKRRLGTVSSVTVLCGGVEAIHRGTLANDETTSVPRRSGSLVGRSTKSGRGVLCPGSPEYQVVREQLPVYVH